MAFARRDGPLRMVESWRASPLVPPPPRAGEVRPKAGEGVALTFPRRPQSLATSVSHSPWPGPTRPPSRRASPPTPRLRRTKANLQTRRSFSEGGGEPNRLCSLDAGLAPAPVSRFFASGPRGGTGRRNGLKIRSSERDVTVRLGPGPPCRLVADLLAQTYNPRCAPRVAEAKVEAVRKSVRPKGLCRFKSGRSHHIRLYA
jgi:hypothetical protein